MDKIKLGIIGTNFVSDWLCEAADEIPSYINYAVLSRTEKKGRKFASSHGIENVFCEPDPFFESGIDAVYIASPNCFHYEYATAALKRGIHVLCEKPIASDEGEFLSMKEASEKNGAVLLEAMRPAYDASLEAIKKALSEIGRVRGARFEFCQYSSRFDAYKRGEILRAFDPSFSNAAIMDIGVYPVHLCLRLFGYPEGEIKTSSVFLENGFEGAGEVILPYDGFDAIIVYSKIYDSVCPSVISGENGSILIDKISATEKLKLRKKGEAETDIPFEFRKKNMTFELEEFARLIESRNTDHEHNIYSEWEMKLIDEIRKKSGIVFK